MDGTTGKPGGASTHIWLRYATQFTVGERLHTIEMGIPVPIGASAEIRERLFREAEAGMDQLARHVENRVAQVQQRSTPSPGATSSPNSPLHLVPKPANKLASPSTPTSTTTPSPPAPLNSHESPVQAPERNETKVPPTRPNVGASMPGTPGKAGDTSESLKLPQFIQYIKDTLGLTPKQAMDLLKVKALSGLNLREALEQLRQIVPQDTAGTPDTASPPGQQSGTVSEQEEPKVTPFRSTSPPPASNPRPGPKIPGIKEITHAVVREIPPASAFDEEIDLDEEGEMEFVPDLSDEERALAEDVLSKLKEARGSTAASETRLKVLHNVINQQISDEELLQLVEGAWGVTSLKKLKNEQVEALISWAKAADDFISEAEMVLAILQEEQYARSDR